MVERLKLSDKFSPKQVVTRSGTSTQGEFPLNEYKEEAQMRRAAKLETRKINREQKISALKAKEEDAKRILGLRDDLTDSQQTINNFNNAEIEERNLSLDLDKEILINNAVNKADKEEKEKMDKEIIIKQVVLPDTIDLQKEDSGEIIDDNTLSVFGTVQTSTGDERLTPDKCELNPLYPLESDEEGDMTCDRNVEKLDDEPTGVKIEGPTIPPSNNVYYQKLTTDEYNIFAVGLTDYRPLSKSFITVTNQPVTQIDNTLLDYIEKIIKYKIKRPRGSSRNIKTLETYLQEKLTSVFKENSEKEKKERKKKKNKDSVTEDEQVINNVIYRNIFNIKDTDIHSWKEDLEYYVYLNTFEISTEINVKLSSSLILLICYYGVQVFNSSGTAVTLKTTINGNQNISSPIIYKVIKSKGQAEKTVRVGSVAEFPEIVGCQYGIDQLKSNNEQIPKNCTFSYRINTLFNTIDTNIPDTNTKNNVIKSILLWFDTHHDFKKTRFKEVVDYWFDLNPKRFIDYYADQFFVGIGTSNIRFSNDALNTILAPVSRVDNNKILLAKQLYTISVDHLREKDFEKTLLLIYITKYYLKPNSRKFTFKGSNYPYDGKHFLRDILNVKKEDIKTLVDKEIRENPTGNYLKTISDFYGYDFNNARSFDSSIKSDNFPYNFEIDNQVENYINSLPYVKDAGSSSYKLNKLIRKYVPSALFDGNPTNSKELGYNLGNALYNDVRTIYARTNDDYNLTSGLKNTYNYLYNDCKLNVSINTNDTIQKADIRCSKEGSINPFDKPTDITLKQRIETMLRNSIGNKIREKYTFSEKLLEVLKKFTSNEKGDSPKFANFAIKGDGTPLPLKYYFNNRDGPTVPDLMFIIIYTYISSNQVIPLSVLDEILSLKRIGDYGQILDCKNTKLPLFTTDNMQCLICIFEKVSCFIDYSQGPGIIIYNGKQDSIMSRQVFSNIITLNNLDKIFQNSYTRNPPR